MIGTDQVMAALRRRVPDGVRASVLALDATAHTATEVTYRSVAPHAGTVLGIHFPSAWPRSAACVSARWITGENVVVATVEVGAMAPIGALRLMKFWNSGGQCLEIKASVDPTHRPSAPSIARLPSWRPAILLVHPAETGLAKAIRWASGGLARLGRSADAY